MSHWGAAAFAAAATFATGAAALEPGYSDQVFPLAGQLRLVERFVDDGAFLFVETTTMGRVGDTAYVWTVLQRALAGSTPSATRHVIDCVGGVVTDDWTTYFSADLQPASHEQALSSYAPSDGAMLDVVGLACGTATAGGEPFGLVDALQWAAALPVNIYTMPLDEIVNVTESGAGGTYRATWTLRPGARTYAGIWVFEATGQLLADAAEVGDTGNGLLTIPRPSLGADHVPFHGAFPQPGTASWVTDDPGFRMEMSLWATRPLVTAEGIVPAQAVPPPVDTDELPPAFNSFVQVNEGTLPVPLKIYYDENSPSFQNSEGVATAWQFYAYETPFTSDRGETNVGAWVRMDYQCDADPITWRAGTIVPVAGDYTNRPNLKPNDSVRSVPPYTVEGNVARHVCFSEDMPLIQFLNRYDTVEDAVAAAGRDDVVRPDVDFEELLK